MGPGRRDADRSRGEPPQHPRGGRRGRARRRRHPGHRRQRADVARGVGDEPPGRPPEPRPGRRAGRAGRGDRRHGQARRGGALQRPAAVATAGGGEGRGDPRGVVPRAGDRAAPSPRCCSATSTRAASCRSRCRGPSATCRPTTTTSRPRGAGTCSIRWTPLFAFGFGLSYTTFAFTNLRLDRSEIARRRVRARVGGRDQHGAGGGRRGGAALHPRRGEQRHAAGEGAEGVPAHHARRRARRATVTFDVTPEHLAFYDIDMVFRVEPGRVPADGRVVVSGRGSPDNRADGDVKIRRSGGRPGRPPL